MISSIAWRNLWRNKLRSLVIITAVTLGVFAGIFTIGFMNGMVNDRIQSVISLEMSHIQLHYPGFLDNDQFILQLRNADSILEKVNTIPHVLAASKRVIISSMIASAETGTGVYIKGVIPSVEQKVTKLNTKIIKGKYLDETGKNPVVIGERLADKLKVGLKNKVIITVQDVNKNIISGAFRIVGIYKTDNMMFDDVNVFVRYNDICQLSGLKENEAHEIAVLLNENTIATEISKLISGHFPGVEVKDWQELSPEAGYLVSAMNQYMYIFMLIILLALCFGIINTMLMVIMERIRELGMLMAIGMNRIRIFNMIMLETVYLSLTGGILGIILSYITIKYFEKTGIDLYFWKEAFAEVGYSSIVYPVIGLDSLIITAIMVIFTGMMSALYPAYKALKLKPAEALQT